MEQTGVNDRGFRLWSVATKLGPRNYLNWVGACACRYLQGWNTLPEFLCMSVGVPGCVGWRYKYWMFSPILMSLINSYAVVSIS